MLRTAAVSRTRAPNSGFSAPAPRGAFGVPLLDQFLELGDFAGHGLADLTPRLANVIRLCVRAPRFPSAAAPGPPPAATDRGRPRQRSGPPPAEALTGSSAAPTAGRGWTPPAGRPSASAAAASPAAHPANGARTPPDFLATSGRCQATGWPAAAGGASSNGRALHNDVSSAPTCADTDASTETATPIQMFVCVFACACMQKPTHFVLAWLRRLREAIARQPRRRAQVVTRGRH